MSGCLVCGSDERHYDAGDCIPIFEQRIAELEKELEQVKEAHLNDVLCYEQQVKDLQRANGMLYAARCSANVAIAAAEKDHNYRSCPACYEPPFEKCALALALAALDGKEQP